VRLTPGSPPALEREAVAGSIKPTLKRRPRNGEGAEGGRSTGSTEDSGPEKPGNSVEEKTLKTGTQRGWSAPGKEPAACDGLTHLTGSEDSSEKTRAPRPSPGWGAGSRGREARRTSQGSRPREREQGARKPYRGWRGPRATEPEPPRRSRAIRPQAQRVALSRQALGGKVPEDEK
jgi:hypothetical protein